MSWQTAQLTRSGRVLFIVTFTSETAIKRQKLANYINQIYKEILAGNEPDTLTYKIYSSSADGELKFNILEEYTNREAFRKHQEGAAHVVFQRQLKAENLGSVHIEWLDEV